MSDRQQPLSGRLSLIRFRMRNERLRFSDEIRLVPHWLTSTLGGLIIFSDVVVALLVLSGAVDPPTGPDSSRHAGALAAAAIVTVTGALLAATIMLIVYVNKDAARRGMNAGLWTVLVTILLPAWVLTGFVIYFLVREPLPFHCPRCGAMVSARFNYCPGCKYNLRPTCPLCRHEVRDTDHFCVYCGGELAPEMEAGRTYGKTSAEQAPQ